MPLHTWLRATRHLVNWGHRVQLAGTRPQERPECFSRLPFCQTQAREKKRFSLREEVNGAAFSEMVPHVSRMLCFWSGSREAVRASLVVSRSRIPSRPGTGVQYSLLVSRRYHIISIDLLSVRAGMHLRSQGWG